jgi:mannosyltransferase
VSEDYVVFVGSRVSYKNFPLLVKALRHLPDLRLFVVGGGQFSRSELTLLERLLSGRYFHQGNITIDRLKHIYSHAVCLVYPTAYEGFGIPVLEAMATGCPVIAMKSSSIPEVAGDAAVLLEGPDERDLADAILQVSRSDMRQDLIAKGIERARLFSWDATFEKTRTVYEALLGRTLQ